MVADYWSCSSYHLKPSTSVVFSVVLRVVWSLYQLGICSSLLPLCMLLSFNQYITGISHHTLMSPMTNASAFISLKICLVWGVYGIYCDIKFGTFRAFYPWCEVLIIIIFCQAIAEIFPGQSHF